MTYTVTKTNGAILATIADGTIDTSTSITLIGKNYAGYGQFLNNDLVHIVENFANSSAPANPLAGQIWWDTSVSGLKIYTGSSWKVISSSTASASAPSGPVTGDLWFDTANQQLKVYNGTTWLLVGPTSGSGSGTSGQVITTIIDNTTASHVVVQDFVNNTLVGIISKDPAFTPQSSISGFATVNPGYNLSTAISGAQFWGTANSTASLNGLTSGQFMRSDANTSTTGTLTVSNNLGLIVGTGADFKISVSGTTVTLANQDSNGNLNLQVNKAGTPTNVMSFNGSTGVGTISSDLMPSANNAINLGSVSTIFAAVYAGNFIGNSTTAKYADLAERFEADAAYTPGTVVELGGAREITAVQNELSEDVYGVVSDKPAFLMNGLAGTDASHPAIAQIGRVKVNVIGSVKRGDRLVSAGQGRARAAAKGEFTAFNVIGRSLEDKLTTDSGQVEATVRLN